MLSSQPTATAIGVDFGGTSIKLGVARGAELLQIGEPITTADYPVPNDLIGAIAERVAKMRQSHPDVCGVGVGVPGLVNFHTGVVHVLTNVPGWVQIPLKEILTRLTGLPCVVENDANAMTYAEWRYGAGAGLQNVVGLTLGTGVGGGLILDGRMYRGSQFAAGEIGQMSIHMNGVSGHYGNLGALEKYIGNNQIAEHAQRVYSQAGLHRDLSQCTPKAIADAAAAGDAAALGIWKEIAEWLGTSLGSIAWLLNPDAFVIGGGVAQAGPILFEPLEAKVRSMLSEVVGQNLRIVPARFSNEAGIIGNAALAGDHAAAIHGRAL